MRRRNGRADGPHTNANTESSTTDYSDSISLSSIFPSCIFLVQATQRATLPLLMLMLTTKLHSLDDHQKV